MRLKGVEPALAGSEGDIHGWRPALKPSPLEAGGASLAAFRLAARGRPRIAEQRHDDILLLATRYGRSTAGATAAGAQASHLTSTDTVPRTRPEEPAT